MSAHKVCRVSPVIQCVFWCWEIKTQTKCESVSSCIQKRAVITFLSVCYAVLWHSPSNSLRRSGFTCLRWCSRRRRRGRRKRRRRSEYKQGRVSEVANSVLHLIYSMNTFCHPVQTFASLLLFESRIYLCKFSPSLAFSSYNALGDMQSKDFFFFIKMHLIKVSNVLNKSMFSFV